MAHFEDYSTNFGPATIGQDGSSVVWKLNYGGAVYSGSIPIPEPTGQNLEAALAAARKAVTALGLNLSKGQPAGENVNVQAAPGNEPVAEGPVDAPAADPVV